jgi:hypothetical protein
MKKIPVVFLLSASLIILTVACNKNNSSNPATLTLYDSLGGTTMVQDPTAAAGTMIEAGRLGIRSVVDSAIFVIAADTKINHYFNVLLAEVTAGDLSGFQELSGNLTDFFSVATGAKDYTYTGLSMTVAHNPGTDTTIANPRISEKVDSDDFDEFINDLGIAAGKNGLPDYLTARVAAVAETVKGQVVQR